MSFHDPFMACLMVLLAVLLCGERSVRVFVSGLWRSVPLDVWRQGGCHMAGMVLALLTLAVVPHAGAAACLMAVSLVLLGGGRVFQPVWGVPALVGYGLFPAEAGGLGVMAVCFWAAGRAVGEREAARSVALILMLGLGHEMAARHPLDWMLGVAGLVGLCLMAGMWADRLFLYRYCRLVRPVLLLGVMEVSRQQGMELGVEGAFFALLLDLAGQCLAVVWPRASLLMLPAPPLPGFVVGWVGLHASLGLSSSTEGWTVMGCLLGVAIMGLSLGDGVLVLSQAAPALRDGLRRHWAWGLCLAVILPPACGMAADWLTGYGAGWASWLYRLPGGDGSMMALPLFWGVMLPVWLCLSRRRRGSSEGGLFLEEEGETGLAGLQSYMQAAPVCPHSLKRLLMRGKRQARSVRLSATELLSLLPAQELGAVFWLVFLGCVLVVMGLAQ
ncbi:hypothetical protein NQF87_06755 [Bombella sp. TMW 2.2559]|uniref:Prepilin type IV endopeptidase peptidase domain-containing protein n=1 Tax=Bombella dulcis TaxID=2967339 RepID=A0ABT3WD92_9PROT|nr:hypothetical protein [Bombella dulcis]MCX5616668.1 hypothetical protein [Bombella dulcis]